MSNGSVIVTRHGRTFDADMAEISGFGGSYERGCREMMLAGLRWLEANPGMDPIVLTPRGVIGVDINGNPAAKSLESAMLDAPFTDDDGNEATVRAYGATGAMVQFSKAHAMKAKEMGWDEYCRQSRLNWLSPDDRQELAS